MSKTMKPNPTELESYLPSEKIDTNPESVNLTKYIDQAGRVHLVYDPSEIIPDAGTVRMFRGQRSDPKAGDTVSNNGRMWNLVRINGHVYREGFMVIHLEDEPTPRASNNRPPRPAPKRLW